MTCCVKNYCPFYSYSFLSATLSLHFHNHFFFIYEYLCVLYLKTTFSPIMCLCLLTFYTNGSKEWIEKNLKKKKSSRWEGFVFVCLLSRRISATLKTLYIPLCAETIAVVSETTWGNWPLNLLKGRYGRVEREKEKSLGRLTFFHPH